MNDSPQGICAIPGVRAAGIKEGKFGLALIEAEGSAAGVFTSNLMKAAPVRLMEERLSRGHLSGVIANSGCANSYTGERGYQDAVELAVVGGEVLGADPRDVGVASTGVIGRFLDMPLIRDQARRVAPTLASSALAEHQVARAIMTTDLVEKHALARRETFSVAGVCKGSGMIAPNMGTMIAFLYTDATVDAAVLREELRTACRRTFNRVVVDGDTSTNDIAICTATGRVGKVPRAELAGALEECCRALAVQIAADGEGATKLIEVTVEGAPSEEEAATVARTVVGSPLVKTAVYGEDPNWGRVIAAAGRAGVSFDAERVSLTMGDGISTLPLVTDGKIVVDLARAKAAMAGKKVTFTLAIGAGPSRATAWGCDLTERYIEINGRYTT